jgi:hypothetical protein
MGLREAAPPAFVRWWCQDPPGRPHDVRHRRAPSDAGGGVSVTRAWCGPGGYIQGGTRGKRVESARGAINCPAAA